MHRLRLTNPAFRTRVWVVPVMLVAILMAACSPSSRAPASATTATSEGAPRRGGVARVGISQEPNVLNPLIGSQVIATSVAANILEGLLAIGPNGTYEPALAAEVPTTANGGVSADGRTITWKLKPGLTWSDGAPLTSRDVLFTYQVMLNPDNPIVFRSGYTDMDSVTAPDATTVVVRYSRLYSGFQVHFPYILPEHALGGDTNIDKKEFNRAPIGSGPFKFTSWSAGDTITLERNEHFRDQGKPYLDGLVFKVVPSRETSVQAFKTGEIDVLWNLAESNIPEFEAIPDAVLKPTPSPRVERLILNASCPSGPQQGDPACPHPVLGDPRVREAIELVIDKKALVDKLLYGKTTVGTSVIPIGWFAPTLPASAYDPTRSRQLLEQAGWVPGPDGVRSKNDVRARIEFGTTTGDRLREQTQQVIQEQLKDVGIEVEIKNAPSAVVLGAWQDNAPRARGNFDMLMWTTNVEGLDPQGHLYGYFHSSQIPTEQSRGGRNYHRIIDPELDRALEIAESTLDEPTRKAAYQTVAERVNADRGHIVLYDRLLINAYKRNVKGWNVNVYDNNVTWDSAAWWLEK